MICMWNQYVDISPSAVVQIVALAHFFALFFGVSALRGLGKTVMLLALILKCKELDGGGRRQGPTLVVCPLSLVQQWAEEIETKSSLSYIVFYGDQKPTSCDFGGADIVITTYGTPQAELQKKTRVNIDRSYGLLEHNWSRVILDEAHNVKNQSKLASKACCMLKSTYRWVVTGTIIHNSLDDVFGLVKFLKHQPWSEPGFWKAAITTEMNRRDAPEANDGRAAEQTGMSVALGRVRRLLLPIMIRRTKDSLSPDG